MGSGEKTFALDGEDFGLGGLLCRLASPKPHILLLQLGDKVSKIISKTGEEDKVCRDLDPEWRKSHPGDISMFQQV